MPLYKTHGIVLNTYKLGEADRIVILISPERGKIRAVGKGVRKTKSKFGSRLEPFTHLDLLVYEGKTLDIINQAEIVESNKEVRTDLEKLKYGAVMLELTEKVIQENEDSRQVFALLVSMLTELKETGSRYGLLLAIFDLKLMSIIGFSPRDPSAMPLSKTHRSLLPLLLDATSKDWKDIEASEASEKEILRLANEFASYHIDRPIKSSRLLEM